MFSYIKGELTEVNPDHIVLEAGGIGYMIYVPTLALEYLPETGNEVKIYTYLYFREDLVVLYGFLSREDLEVFKLLIAISGIGPKAAVGILSAMSAEDLQFAVISQDAKAIAKAPGIGSKTAQRVILELKDKLSFEEVLENKLEKGTGAAAPAAGTGTVKNEAVMALTALGYSSSESLKAVSKVDITPEMNVEEVLKQALKHMALF